MTPSLPSSLVTRLLVEEFVYREAALLDEWRLDDWLALFTDACAYEVTAPNIEEPETISRQDAYFLIGDDRHRLEHRIARMKRPTAHVEYPRSKTRHLYANVLVTKEDDAQVEASVHFLTLRTRRGTSEYFGKILFRLERSDDGFRIASKRVIMDIDTLVQGRVSIFL